MKTIAKIKFSRIALIAFNLFILGVILFTSCQKQKKAAPITRKQIVSQSQLHGVRLADGMPLMINVSTRWEVLDYDLFEEKFGTAGKYETLVLNPKQLELASQVAIGYEHVDSVFTTKREEFIRSLKVHLMKNLGEKDVMVKDVIISKVEFPSTYTSMKERLALQDQELRSIKKQSVIDLEQAEAQKQKAIAQGEVNVEQAQLDARLEKIRAEMEKDRRAGQLARAETEKQVAAKRAESDARRQVLMAEADARQRELYADVEVQKSRKMKEVEVEREAELAEVELNKKRMNEDIQFQQDVKMAGLCEDNPSYVSYLVNKQLAEQVQIALVPSGKNELVFDGLLTKNVEFKK